MRRFHTIIATLFFLSINAIVHAQSTQGFTVVGAMKNVMWKGQLQGTIRLDTIQPRQHLYGLGPVAHLTGELLILDGTAYRSTLTSDTSMQVTETFDVQAPFFGYTHVEQWRQQAVPDSVQTLAQIESWLIAIAGRNQTFAFQLQGKVQAATIHVVNLPAGATVSSPDDAHQGQRRFRVHNKGATVLGFFSTRHQAVFTHHDSFVHMHLLTADKKLMGHVDALQLQPGAIQLWLPANVTVQ